MLHSRNALKDIWYGDALSSIYPPSIWYYLNYKDPKNPRGLSLRERIIDRRKGFDQVETEEPGQVGAFEKLYLGQKGQYGTEELYNRAKMYDQIESYLILKVIKRNLTALSLEISW